MKESAAKIFLSDQRGCTLDSDHRVFHTFNFGTYFSEHRKPPGKLLFLNDVTLAAGATKALLIDKEMQILVLPIIGALQLISLPNSALIEAGEWFSCCVKPDSNCKLTNPYKTESINFLIIGFESVEVQPMKGQFNLEENSNNLIPVGENRMGYIGKYQGRKGGSLGFGVNYDVFIFLIEGAAEVQNRLLHARDGLALWNANEIEFEALSREVILLILPV